MHPFRHIKFFIWADSNIMWSMSLVLSLPIITLQFKLDIRGDLNSE